jgi:hypothetical protein
MIRSRMLDMSRSTRRVAACAAFGALALGLSACGSATNSDAATPPAVAATTPSTADPSVVPTPDATPGPTTSGAAYVVFPNAVPADNWEITDAARKDDPATAGDLDSVDGLAWSAQYQDGSVEDETKAPYVMISGFNSNFADVVSDVAGDDAQRTDGQINGHQAAWGTLTGQDAGDTNTFVIMEITPGHTVELDGANLSADTLKTYAGLLQPAGEQDWAQVHANADSDDSDDTGSDDNATDSPSPATQ